MEAEERERVRESEVEMVFILRECLGNIEGSFRKFFPD